MQSNQIFDVVIIGSGPSGIFASLKLVDSDLKIGILDSGPGYYKKGGKNNKKLNGFGGAAMRYDFNLDYYDGTRKGSVLAGGVFKNSSAANLLIKDVYAQFIRFGLNKNKKKVKTDIKANKNSLKIIERKILPVGNKEANKILKNIYDYLLSKNISFFEFTEVVQIRNKGLFELQTVTSDKKQKIIKARIVIVATGKKSVFQFRNIFQELNLKTEPCHSIDIGVRIETNKKFTQQITKDFLNPKIICNDMNGISRTFCWCPGGGVISYDFEGLTIIDGQHNHDKQTKQTNFGILVTTKLPARVDGTMFGWSYIKMFNDFTGYKVGVQILKDFKVGIASSITNIKNNNIHPSLSKYSLIDLGPLFIFNAKQRIINLIAKINKVYPGAVPDNSLVYGPVLERIIPEVIVNHNMESSVHGLYVVGDISGKGVGVVTGAAMGIKAAEHILEVNKKQYD